MSEPTSSLTLNEKNSLFQVIQSLKNNGKVIIYISHFLDDVINLCEQVIILRDGEIVRNQKSSILDKHSIIKDILGTKKIQNLDFQYPQASKRKILFSVKNVRYKNTMSPINFNLYAGEIVGLWGLLGSGRTEIFQALVGLIPILEGQIYLNHRGELKNITPNDLRKKIGYITENQRESGLFSTLPVWQNITAASTYKYKKVFGVLNTLKEQQDALSFVEFLNITTPSIHCSAGQLSGGNQQKMIFAKWLNRNPKILFLDEPTRGMDISAKYEILNRIKDLALKGNSVLMISSEIDELLKICDRIFTLYQCNIISEFSKENFNQEEIMHSQWGPL